MIFHKNVQDFLKCKFWEFFPPEFFFLIWPDKVFSWWDWRLQPNQDLTATLGWTKGPVLRRIRCVLLGLRLRANHSLQTTATKLEPQWWRQSQNNNQPQGQSFLENNCYNKLSSAKDRRKVSFWIHGGLEDVHGSWLETWRKGSYLTSHDVLVRWSGRYPESLMKI